MENLKLSKPFEVGTEDGQKMLTELAYDFDTMTAKDRVAAAKLAKMNGVIGGVQELDGEYQLFLFAQNAAKHNPGVTVDDILRMNAKDSMKASEAARSYFFVDSAEQNSSMTNTSEK